MNKTKRFLIKKIWNALDDNIRELLKNAVEYAKAKMNEHNAMVITRDRSQKDVDELIHSIEGLADECAHWIRCWGSGGGDYSTEACITEAIRTEHSNCAPEIAVTIFESVANYSKSAFEASILTMEIVNESLRECGMEL